MPYGNLLADVVQSSTTGTPPQFNDGNGTQTGTLCRAWVNFNGTGTVAIRASFNVSSITDNGVGLYAVNFTSAMPDTNYAPVATCTHAAGIVPTGTVSFSQQPMGTTTSVPFYTAYGAGTVFDSLCVVIAVFR